ncbi:MAG: exo-alpha-sialidase, partial [Planctomycetales bacterium]|nr:exo-alpha-sialidase [Planctomycetales bacterium]
VVVGLVPCAVGGSPISSWQPGGFHEQTHSHPYDDMLARMSVALQAGELKGILWHQGESDSNEVNAPLYRQRLTELIGRLRSDFRSPKVPFVMGQMGQFPGKPWDAWRFQVDAASQQVTREVANVALVSSQNLIHRGDEVHFDSWSYRELGNRYYDAFHWLQQRQPTHRLSTTSENPRNTEGDFIRLSSGDLLHIYSRFSSGSSDHAAAELASRRSSDGGKTWSHQDRIEVANEASMNVMSVSLLRLRDGRIALFYLQKESLTDCRPVVRFSSDEAQSWSQPTAIIPDSLRGYYVLNNDRVIQTEAGRLICPVAWHRSPDQSQADWAGIVSVFFSDDGGTSWQQSLTKQRAFASSGARIWAQEPGVVQLSDGRLWMWVRTNAGWQYGCYSHDDGKTWSEFVPTGLASPRSPASIEVIPGSHDLLAVWNDHSDREVDQRVLRTPLCYAISQDDGITWSKPSVIASDPTGWYCYTALEFVDENLVLAYASGSQRSGEQLSGTDFLRLPIDDLYSQAGLARIEQVQRIWQSAPHNAFTDLIRFRDKWFCVFREGTGHVSPDGALRVISSTDGANWKSAALIRSENSDLRDAKITSTPDGRLMLSGAGALHDQSQGRHQSFAWFSKDGYEWTKPESIGDLNYWLWRTTWNSREALTIGYATGENLPREVRLYHSTDGVRFETLVANLGITEYPNESSIVFDRDQTAYCLLRRDEHGAHGLLGVSHPPFKDWQWKDIGVRIGGPHMILLPDGRVVAAVRLYDHQVRTSLGWINFETGKFNEFLTLPSGGDTSYAGLVWHDDRLHVSYYSAHESSEQEFKTAIYFATVSLPAANVTAR